MKGESDSNLNRSCINAASGGDANPNLQLHHPVSAADHPTTITPNWRMEGSHDFLDDEIPTADIFSFLSGNQQPAAAPNEGESIITCRVPQQQCSSPRLSDENKLHTESISVERSTLNLQNKPQRPPNQAHSTAEKRRRDKFKEKIKVMEGLLPNCRKKDTTSILDEAVKNIQLLKSQIEWLKASYSSFGGSHISSVHGTMVPSTFVRTGLLSANVIGQVGFGAGANAGISPMHATMDSPTLIIPTRLVSANVIDIGADADAGTTLYPTMLPSPSASAGIQITVPQIQMQPFHMASTSSVDTTGTSFAIGGSSSCAQTSNASD